MKMLAAACLLVLSLPLFADTVRTVDGRELKGDVTEEGDKVVVKMKIGTVKLDKSQVKEIVREGDGGTPGGGPTPAGGSKSAVSYKSYLLGYVLQVPGTRYVLQRVPPQPLTDVMLYDSGNEAVISLGLCLFEPFPATLTGADTAKQLGEAARNGMSIYFSKLDIVSAAPVHMGSYDTVQVVMEGEQAVTQRKQHLTYVFFRMHDKPMLLDGEGLRAKCKDLDSDMRKIVETLQEFEPKEMDGNTYVDMTGCYTMTKPDSMKVAKNEDPQSGVRATVLSCESPRCFFSVLVTMVRSKGDMREVGKFAETALQVARPDNKVTSSKVVNLKGRVAWEVCSTSEQGPKGINLGPVISRAVAFRTVDRIYLVDSTALAPDAAKAEALTGPLFESFEIYPDLLSKGSLENGRAAMHASREGDERRMGGHGAKEAIPCYDKAIELYPPFAQAYNNRALAYDDIDDFDHAYKDLQQALELAPDDYMISRNMAFSRITKATKSLDEGRITAAVDEANRVMARAKDDPQLSNALGIFYFEVGNFYIKNKKLGAAKAFFKKGMNFYADKDAVKKALSEIAMFEGVDEANKGNWRAAKSHLEEALKYDPQNGEAKELLDKVNQELSK